MLWNFQVLLTTLVVLIGSVAADEPVCSKLKGGSPVGLEYSCRIKNYEPTFAVVSVVGPSKTVKFGYTLIRADNGNCGGGTNYKNEMDVSVTSDKPRQYLIQSTIGTKCERLLIYLCTIGNAPADCTTNLQVTFKKGPLSSQLPGPCLKKSRECTIGDNYCCEGLYCIKNTNGRAYCYTCNPDNEGCNVGGQQCCQTSSCQKAVNNGLCMSGMCSKPGEDCSKPCCDSLTCQNYQGKMQCRPIVPTCYGKDDKSPCPGNGISCCSRRCSGPITSVCECSQMAYGCKMDADCCAGLRCGLNYRCMTA